MEKLEGRLVERLNRIETLLSNVVGHSESSQVTPDTRRNNSNSTTSSSSNSGSSTATRKRTLTLEAALSIKKTSYKQQQFFHSIVEDEDN